MSVRAARCCQFRVKALYLHENWAVEAPLPLPVGSRSTGHWPIGLWVGSWEVIPSTTAGPAPDDTNLQHITHTQQSRTPRHYKADSIGGETMSPTEEKSISPLSVHLVTRVMEQMKIQIDGLLHRNSALEAENRALGNRCKSLEQSIEVLSKDIDWKYSPPHIPRSYWLEQGFDDEYATEAMSFIEYLKDDAEEARNDADAMMEVVEIGASLPEGMILRYDDALLPHFAELADAIRINPNIVTLHLWQIELNPSVIQVLLSATRHNENIDDIGFFNVRISDDEECILSLDDFVSTLPSLRSLLWRRDGRESTRITSMLAGTAVRCESIRNFDLIKCFRGEERAAVGMDILASILTSGKQLRCVHFGGNDLSGIVPICDALADNPPITMLDLRDNLLDDEDATSIAEALASNVTLRRLFLGKNRFTDAGKRVLISAVHDSSDLNTLSRCNHTCRISDIDDERGINAQENVSEFSDWQFNRGIKIYDEISEQCSENNVALLLDKELGESSILLLPKVLELVQTYSFDVSSRKGSGSHPIQSPLSIYFDLLKTWKMPEIFERKM